MKEVTLYGQGAVSLHDGKNVIRSNDGRITVPEHLVARVEALGFSRTVRGAPADIVTEPVPGVDPPKPAPVGETHDEKVARYRREIEERGYMGDALDAILAERLAFDELVAGGMSEEDAAKKVWGGGEPSTEEIVASSLSDAHAIEPVNTNTRETNSLANDETMKADVGALSADVNEADADQTD